VVKKEEMMKKWVTVAVSLVLLAGMAGISGCAWIPNTAPMEPFTGYLSFPDGAPPLGQTAELVYVVKAEAISINNMSLRIDLPEAFELVSGDLSWTGDIPKGDEVEVIRAVVKSVETGNWTIEATGYLNPQENAGWEMDGSGPGPIGYVSISEGSAEWGRYPPWYKKGPVKLEQEEEGDVEGVESSQDEPPVEELPEPPALSVNGTVQQK
jgi:hypothetical protein